MRLCISTYLLGLLIPLVVCAQEKKPSFEDAIAKLQGTDSKQWDNAADDLIVMSTDGLTVEQGILIATMASDKRFASDAGHPVRTVAAQLLHALDSQPRPEYLKIITEGYDAYPSDAKAEAMAIFVGLGPGDGLKAFVSRLGDKTETGSSCEAAFKNLTSNDPAVLDALLRMLRYDGTTETAVASLLDFAEKGKLPAGALADHLPEISECYERWLDKLSQLKGTLHSDINADYRWDDQYREAQSVAEYFPDLLGHAGPAAEGMLRKTFAINDPRLSLFALRSLLVLKKDLPDEAVNMVAADDEMRGMLYESFRSNGIQQRFPAKFATQEALARSEMVRWLIYPTELDRAPNDIELMKVVSQETGGPDGIVDIYLFRFRTTGTHWVAKDGWMVGIAGGYRRADEPTTEDLGETFSNFEKWDGKTPEQHVDDIVRLVREAWKQQGKKAQ